MLPSPHSGPNAPGSTINDALDRILASYAEMPGLCLTREQAIRLFALEPGTCEQLMLALVQAGRLRVGPRGFMRC
jgi:hypothetical protein